MTDDLPTPNVYFVTVHHGHQAHHLYIGADYSGAALQKAANHCAEHLGFRPYRSTSVIRMRRFRRRDYQEHPQGLIQAIQHAHETHERSLAETLQARADELGIAPLRVDRLLDKLTAALKKSA